MNSHHSTTYYSRTYRVTGLTFLAYIGNLVIVRIKVRRWWVETRFTQGGLRLLRWRLLARSTHGGLLLLSLFDFRCRGSNIALHVNLSRHYIQPQFTAGFTQNKLHDIRHLPVFDVNAINSKQLITFLNFPTSLCRALR